MAPQSHPTHDDTPRPDARQLAVTASAGRILTKAQKAFNRLITRVEMLRAEIKSTTSRLERALREHEREMRPRLDTLAGIRKELARALAPFLRDPRLKRASDRQLLSNVVVNLIDGAAAHEGGIVDEDLRTLFDALTEDTRTTDHDDDRAAFEAMRAEVESTFAAMGVKIDLSDLRPDATEQELHARVNEALHAARERGAPEQPTGARPPRRTKKQLEREERLREAEEARRRTISTIYKQLAKTLHPDLEPDPERRHHKLALMQELTAAYRANDLHTLLRLELEWLHREEGDLQRLTDEKLAVYISVLREQVTGLEAERDALSHHPRFQALMVDDGPFGVRLELDSTFRRSELDASLRNMRSDLKRLRGPDAWSEVRSLLKGLRAEKRMSRRMKF